MAFLSYILLLELIYLNNPTAFNRLYTAVAFSALVEKDSGKKRLSPLPDIKL